ncbi:MAG: hypothetical protein ACMXYM_01165 [Candidatus Woesearchaeota archaeon]
MRLERIVFIALVSITLVPIVSSQSLMIEGEARSDGNIRVFEMYLANAPPSTFSRSEQVWDFEITNTQGSIASRVQYSPRAGIITDRDGRLERTQTDVSRFRLSIPLPSDAVALAIRYEGRLVSYTHFQEDYCDGARLCSDCHRFLGFECGHTRVEEDSVEQQDTLAVVMLALITTIIAGAALVVWRKKQL